MARSVANVVVSTDTFANWIGKTNQLADAMSVYTVTVDSTANGANVSGNGFVVGILQANTLAAGDVLRGGSVNASANLNITLMLLMLTSTLLLHTLLVDLLT